jgi:hypothetical protein
VSLASAQTPKTDAQRASKAAASLRAVAIEDMDTNVPPEAQKLILDLRAAVHDLAGHIIASHNGKVTAIALTSEIQKALYAADLAPIDPAEHPHEKAGDNKFKNVYGNITTAAFDAVDGHSDLMVFRTNQIISCGTDSSFYVFQWKDGKWIDVLDYSAPKYAEISGAFEGLDYAVSPSAPDGSWFVVAADWMPWCTSNWPGMSYVALRPSGKAAEPKVKAWKAMLFLGGDQRFALSTKSNAFTVSYVGSFGDPALLTRVHIDRYEYVDGDFKRAAPVASDALDFVDEWIALPWADAQRWTAFAATDAVKWHKSLNHSENKNPLEWSVAFFQPCLGGKKWQIGLDTDGDENPAKHLYFTIEKGTDFQLTAVGPNRAAGCPGETAVKERSLKLP